MTKGSAEMTLLVLTRKRRKQLHKPKTILL